MKKIFLVALMLSFVACAGQKATTMQPQEIVVTVRSAEAVDVNVDDSKPIVRSMEVHNPEAILSGISFIVGDKAFTKIFSGLSIIDVTRFWNDLVYLEYNTTIRDLNIFMNSPGGDAFSGLALADQIERAQKIGFKVTAHASGIIASAAVPVFAVCDKRFAASGTIFMVHEASLWKWPGNETASDIRSQNNLMGLLQKKYIEKLANRSKLSVTEWKELEKCTTWFSAERALDYGLVDSIE